MTSRTTARPGAWVSRLLVLAGVAVVAVLVARQSPDVLDRRPSYTAPFTAEEMRLRPDITQVVPRHAEATAAVMDALTRAAGITWEPVDAQVFTHQRDGKDEQLVDGYPVLRWTPEHIASAGTLDLDEATVAQLADVWRQTLEPLGYDVSTANRSTRQNRHLVTFRAADDQDASLQLFDDGDGRLRIIVTTWVHLYRDPSCVPDPLACEPDVTALTDAF